MSYNTAAIRKLLDAIFDDEELTTFCYDHFRPVHKKFSTGVSRLRKIQLLIEYCERHDQFSKLLTLTKEINAKQYTKFATSIIVPPMPGDFLKKTHSLSVTLETGEEIYEGNNALRLVVHNTAFVDYQYAVIRLEAPSGISLLPNKLEVSPLPTNSRKAVPVTLYAARPGLYQVGVRVSSFPAPKEGFLHTQLQIDVLPRPEMLSSLKPELIFDTLTDSSATVDDDLPYPDVPGEGSPYHRDIYSPYEIGLRKLLDRMERHHPRYSDALTYQQRLKENITQSRKYGDTNTRKAERAEIIDQLNELALSVLDIPFNELCK